MPHESSHTFLFYIEDLAAEESTALVTGPEHHHLSRVLRLKVGEEAFVTDGRGTLLRCRVKQKSKRWTRVDLLSREPVRPARNPVTVALACIRKDFFERAVEQCTELGVIRFVPFSSEKSHVKTFQTPFIDRLKRISQAAMTQSFQAFLPDIENVIPFEGLFQLKKETDLTIVGDMDAAPLGSPRSRTSTLNESAFTSFAGKLLPRAGASVLIVVGPEGGFTPDERDRLERCGCVFVSSARTRLRSETAAVALASIVLSLPD